MQRNRSHNSSGFRLDRRDMESRARLIEESISSLNSTISSSSKSNALRSTHQLVSSLSDAISEFLDSGARLASEHPEARNELNIELTKLRESAARSLVQSASEFANDPSSGSKKNQLGTSARLLLNSVSRVIAIAELIDSHSIRPLVDALAQYLRDMNQMKSIEEFAPAFKTYSDNLKTLINLCSRALQVRLKRASNRIQ